MKLETAEQIAHLMQRITWITRRIQRIDEAAPGSRIIPGSFDNSEAGESLTPVAAREIRAIMRKDYEATGQTILDELAALGVDR